MLTRLNILGETGEVLSLYATQSNTHRSYRLVDADGLGPPPAILSYSAFTTLDGSVFHNSKYDNRNIVLTVELEPNFGVEGETVQSLRRALYRVARPKTSVRLRLFNDGVYERWINGYVETHEPNIFAKEPSVQISILCLDPALNETPESIVEGPDSRPFTINYNGDVETGFTSHITLGSDCAWVTLQNLTTGSSIRITASGLLAGRRVDINTRKGSRDVVLRNIDTTWRTRLLGSAVATNGWPQLVYGENEMRVIMSSGGPRPARLSYFTRHSGF